MYSEADIIKAIENYYNVSYKAILEKNAQHYPVNVAKSMVIYLFRTLCKMKNRTIAQKFGTTTRNVYYRRQYIAKELRSDGRISKDYNEIINKLKQ